MGDNPSSDYHQAGMFWSHKEIHSVDDIEELADTWQHPSQAAIIPADLLLTIYQADGMPDFIRDWYKARNAE